MNPLRKLTRPSTDDGVAMLSVILLMTIVTLLSVVLLGLVLAQVSPTLHANKNNRTLVAAQAGIDAAVGQLRNATSLEATVEMGDIHKLPCMVVGNVDGSGANGRYEAELQYFVGSPEGKDAAWRAANALTCYTGTGINGGLRAVPHYAVVTSEGFDDSATVMVDRADRVIQATYTFQLTTQKVSGGMILDANGSYCLVADSAAAGSFIRYQSASDTRCAEATDFNTWSWRDDYMLHLTSTDADGSAALCITGRATGETPLAMTLRACNTGTGDTLGQRFSWTGSYTWRGQNAANTAYADSYIVNSDKDSIDAGDRLSISTTVDSAKVLISLQPLGAVGKGNASYATNQVVNQNQFGRCLDVTNTRIYYSYMIAYPCKQDPSGNLAFDWNHKWYYTEPGAGTESVSTQIRVNNGTNYCLITPTATGLQGTPVYSGYTALFPRFVTGNSSSYSANCTSTDTWWMRYGFSNDQYKSYTIQDRYGRCLSAAGPKITQDGAAGAWTSITVEPCNGKDDQKWNVPDTPVGASIGRYTELTGRSGG